MKNDEKKKIIVLVGPFASGKTEIQKRLCQNVGFVRGVSACNEARGLRPGEVDGIDYSVMTDKEMDEKIANGEALEYTKYLVGDKVFRYAMLRSAISDDDITVIVVNPRGIKSLIQYSDIKERMKIYYVITSEDVRVKRYLEREGNKNGVSQRLKDRIVADRNDFSSFVDFLEANGLDYELVFNGEGTSLDSISNEIYKQNKPTN